MESFTPFSALAGGALIGLAASLLLLFHGRIAGISGILGETLRGEGIRGEGSFRAAFLAGLVAAGVALRIFHPAAFASSPGGVAGAPVTVALVAVAGLLVGYGTRLGDGCTSGHGVCGISRLSTRSMVATLTFMATGGVTVFVVRHLLGVGR
ncbi:MAG: putative transrane protein [Myxococcaceae bacterium]|nr:putative transrane protein [Myxococcaceae bacterium]